MLFKEGKSSNKSAMFDAICLLQCIKHKTIQRGFHGLFQSWKFFEIKIFVFRIFINILRVKVF